MAVVDCCLPSPVSASESPRLWGTQSCLQPEIGILQLDCVYTSPGAGQTHIAVPRSRLGLSSHLSNRCWRCGLEGPLGVARIWESSHPSGNRPHTERLWGRWPRAGRGYGHRSILWIREIKWSHRHVKWLASQIVVESQYTPGGDRDSPSQERGVQGRCG